MKLYTAGKAAPGEMYPADMSRASHPSAEISAMLLQEAEIRRIVFELLTFPKD